MKNYLLIILLALFTGPLYAQPFQIGHTTVTFTDSSRNNRNIQTEIYYPADVAGDNVAVTVASNDKFPVIAFGHGFVMTWDAYRNIREAIVPEGFIIAFPTTESGLSPSHLDFGKDLSFVISAVTALTQDSISLFFNRVDTMNCVMGHSMGGGASFLAAQWDSQVKTLATLAPAETNPSAIQAASGLSIPALIFAGANDCVTPPPANQLPMYDSLQSVCKTYISINGGSHCQMAESNFLCNLGEATCTPPPAITRAAQHTVINRYLIPWLQRELKNDCLAAAEFDSLISIDTSITFQGVCQPCVTASVNQQSENPEIKIFPNPFSDKFFIQCGVSNIPMFKAELYSLHGSIFGSWNFTNLAANEKIEISPDQNLIPGMYLLRVNADGRFRMMKILKSDKATK